METTHPESDPKQEKKDDVEIVVQKVPEISAKQENKTQNIELKTNTEVSVTFDVGAGSLNSCDKQNELNEKPGKEIDQICKECPEREEDEEKKSDTSKNAKNEPANKEIISGKNDECTTIKNEFVDLDLENGTNNNTTRNGSSEGKEDVKRTRFSSEVKIVPKPYYNTEIDTIVTLAPASTDDIVLDSPAVLNEASSEYKETPWQHVPSFLPLTLFSCLFCCPMIGLFAVYKSYSVKRSVKRGELHKARQASAQANQLGILTMLIGFLFVLAIITIAVMVSAVS